MTPERKSLTKNLKKIILGALALIVLLPVALTALSSFFLLLIGLIVESSRKDFSIQIQNSPYLLKQVSVPGYALLLKHKGYGGKRDQYFYLRDELDVIQGSPPDEFESLEKLTTFKVVDVREGDEEICIFEDIKNPDIKFSEYCPRIFEINDRAKKFLEDMEVFRQGKKLVLVSDFFKRELKPMYKIASYYIYLCQSENDVLSLYSAIFSEDGFENSEYKFIKSMIVSNETNDEVLALVKSSIVRSPYAEAVKLED